MKLSRTTGTLAGIATAAIAIVLLIPTFTNQEQAPSASTAATPPAAEATSSPALDLLAQIPDAGPAPTQPYDRDEFGPRWADVDRNGCDTRNDMLQRDLVEVTFKPNTHDCVVQRGTLHDPYTGETVTFVRISEGYQPTQVDHLIPLSVAWATGAAEWPADKRLQLANDPSNLQVTTANQLKNDSTPSQWMPIASYTCEYSTRYVQVVHAYELEISTADRTKLAAALSQCASTSP